MMNGLGNPKGWQTRSFSSNLGLLLNLTIAGVKRVERAVSINDGMGFCEIRPIIQNPFSPLVS